MKAYWPALLAMTLAGCEGEPEQFQYSDAQKAWLGAWEFNGSENNGADTDNMLLVFQKNGRVSYKRCVIHTGKGSSRRSVSGPDMPIKTFSDTELTLSPGYSIFRWKTVFTIQRTPYSQNGRSYVQIDEITLRRLQPDEPSTQASWKCNHDDDKDEKEKEEKKKESEENIRRWDKIVSDSR